MAFNSKYPYLRLHDDTSRHNVGTDTIQTSGDVNMTGISVLTQDFHTHSYQLCPMSGPYDAALKIEVSNDNENWTKIAEYSFSTEAGASIAYSDTWAFTYARASVTGNNGNYLINEVHLA